MGNPSLNPYADTIARAALLHAEQGAGDTIQFMQYAPVVAARAGRVLLEVHRGLGPSQRLPGMAAVLERSDQLPPFDLHCPLLSLPLAFGTVLDRIPAAVPYLQVDDERKYRWRTRLSGKEWGNA